MPFIPSASLTEEQAQDYMKVYYATNNLLADAIVQFNTLSRSSPNAADRNLYQLKALDASRKHDLLNSRIHAFIEGTSAVRPPSDEEIAKAQGLIQELATLFARQAHADAIVQLITDGVNAFNGMNQPS